MAGWLLVATTLGLVAFTLTRTLEVRRYSRGHVSAQLAIAGRGLYVSRTPDGTWWKVRLRRCAPACPPAEDRGEPPPDAGVREPRRPFGQGPIAGAVELDPPDR